MLEPAEFASFMPEPDGLTLAAAAEFLAHSRTRTSVFGLGITGAVAAPENVPRLARLTAALGLD